MSIRSSIAEEWAAMFSGHFVPYHKLGPIVATLVTVLFGIFFTHEVVFEANVAVIDLDNTRFSKELTAEINTSPYIRVNEVRIAPTDAVALTQRDRNQAVIVLPKGLQLAVHRGDRSVKVGLIADDTNTAQNAEVYTTVNEIIAETGAELASARARGVSSLGLNSSETSAAMSALQLANRYISNPTGQSSTATIVFLFFFSIMFQAMACLMIVGRLRVTGDWKTKVLTGNVWELAARVLPYALIVTTAITVALAFLYTFGQLRFAGNIFLFVPALFIVAVCNGLLALILSWSCTQPGQGASRMIWLVPPGFILSGATMATHFATDWGHAASFGIPLTWAFRFWRDHGLRGCTFSESLLLYGELFLYLAFIAAILTFLFHREEHKNREMVKTKWQTMQATKTAIKEADAQGAPAPAQAS